MKSVTADKVAEAERPLRYSSAAWALSLFLTASLLILSGCADEGNGPDEGIPASSVLIVPGGTNPVWMLDGEKFLFSYEDELDSVGIFLADTSGGTIERLWALPHNHDYVPAPSGGVETIAFSTPDLDGGVMVLPSGGEGQLLLPGGRRPSWVGPNELVAEDGDSRILLLNLEAEIISIVAEEGFSPVVSSDGELVAFLFGGLGGVSRLKVVAVETGAVQLLYGDLFAADIAWDPVHDWIYLSQLSSLYISSIVRFRLGNGAEVDTLLNSATNPSVSGDGVFILAAKLSGDQEDGIIYFEPETGRVERLLSTGRRPAAAPSGNAALVERYGGIYLVEW